MRGYVSILVVAALAAPVASAQERSTRGTAAQDRARPDHQICRLTEFAAGTVAAVTDGRSFTLTDGREVRLAGIETAFARPQDPPERARPAAAARAALAALVTGKPIVLKHLTPASDRYGRLVAFAFAGESARSVQAELLAQGFARFAANSEAGPCAVDLSTAEGAARVAKLGLWGDPYYVVRQAEHPAEVSAERGRFTLVRGRVVSVRESGGTIYVNFGRRWSEDFTVTIQKRNERLFTTAGLEPKSLRGRLVEVRGHVEERGGPWIEAVRPEQIAVVNAE